MIVFRYRGPHFVEFKDHTALYDRIPRFPGMWITRFAADVTQVDNTHGYHRSHMILSYWMAEKGGHLHLILERGPTGRGPITARVFSNVCTLPGMIYRLLADLVIAVHTLFVVFVVLGGLLALRWRRAAFVHVPCVLWGAWVELAGWICPLTPLEVALRQQAGEVGYAGGFLEQYLVPILYPGDLTRGIQIRLGGVLLVLNVAIYAVVALRWRRRSAQ